MEANTTSLEEFLAKIQPTISVNRCWQEGCKRYIQAHGTFEMPSGQKDYRLCMQHFNEARQFVIQLTRYYEEHS